MSIVVDSMTEEKREEKPIRIVSETEDSSTNYA